MRIIPTITILLAVAAARGPPLPDRVREEKTGMALLLVKPGEFMMGKGPEEDGSDSELPRHRVGIGQPFYLGEKEVTLGQFRAFVEATRYVTDAEKRGKASGWDGTKWGKKSGVSWKTPGFSQETDHPATCVSFNDAQAFCRWLGEGYRLPSEAEWEYAERAGSDVAFHWGTGAETACAYANGADASAGRIFRGWKTASCNDGHPWTAPVGSYRSNRWGFYDMAGNAWEWCADAWHENFTGAPAGQGAWQEGGIAGSRVLKGGSWYFEIPDLRSAHRAVHREYEATNGGGFRVVKDPG